VRRFLGVVVVLELLIGLGALAAPDVDEWLQNRLDPALEGTTEVAPPVTREVTVLRPGQTQVTGVVRRLVAGQVDAAPIPTPFTVEAGVRGVSRADIVRAIVDGKPNTTIHWDGGRPLPISGRGALELGAAQLTADAAGYAWALEGAPRGFEPGGYRCNFTVAVATEGIASVRDAVNFVADENTALQVSRGSAFIRQPPTKLTITAADNAEVVMEGTMVARTAEGQSETGAVEFGPGLYQITLTPVEGGYQVDALLQGPVRY
jgi:hypothetical protein